MKETESLVPWKTYLTLTFESLLAFYLATFCVALFFIHRGDRWLIPGILLGLLYLFVIFVCGKRIIEKVSLATLMLMIPIIPLIALIMVISLIPVLELLR